jgi:hypothetical protein
MDRNNDSGRDDDRNVGAATRTATVNMQIPSTHKGADLNAEVGAVAVAQKKQQQQQYQQQSSLPPGANSGAVRENVNRNRDGQGHPKDLLISLTEVIDENLT